MPASLSLSLSFISPSETLYHAEKMTVGHSRFTYSQLINCSANFFWSSNRKVSGNIFDWPSLDSIPLSEQSTGHFKVQIKGGFETLNSLYGPTLLRCLGILPFYFHKEAALLHLSKLSNYFLPDTETKFYSSRCPTASSRRTK